MNTTIKTISVCAIISIIVSLVVVGLFSPKAIQNIGGQIQNDLWYFTGGIKVGTSGQFSVDKNGVSTQGNEVLVNGTATTTSAIGTSASGTNKGKVCLWNGTQYTIITFASGSTTPAYATSTTCIAN